MSSIRREILRGAFYCDCSDGSVCNISLPGVIPSPALIEAATVTKEGFNPIHLSSDKLKQVLDVHGEIELQSVRDHSDLGRIKGLSDLISSQGGQFGDCYGSRIRQIVAQTSEEQISYLPFYLQMSATHSSLLYFKSILRQGGPS